MATTDKKYLDETGLSHLIGKIKSELNNAVSSATASATAATTKAAAAETAANNATTTANNHIIDNSLHNMKGYNGYMEFSFISNIRYARNYNYTRPHMPGNVRSSYGTMYVEVSVYEPNGDRSSAWNAGGVQLTVINPTTNDTSTQKIATVTPMNDDIFSGTAGSRGGRYTFKIENVVSNAKIVATCQPPYYVSTDKYQHIISQKDSKISTIVKSNLPIQIGCSVNECIMDKTNYGFSYPRVDSSLITLNDLKIKAADNQEYNIYPSSAEGVRVTFNAPKNSTEYYGYILIPVGLGSTGGSYLYQGQPMGVKFPLNLQSVNNAYAKIDGGGIIKFSDLTDQYPDWFNTNGDPIYIYESKEAYDKHQWKYNTSDGKEHSDYKLYRIFRTEALNSKIFPSITIIL